MKVGTKSVLFGAHQFLIHPWFVAAAWWMLYGFPYDPRLWCAFFVHDLGYVGKPNMDGVEGEQHVVFGAELLGLFFGAEWEDFCLYHSRFWCKKESHKPSKLCFADKLAICLEPWWFYLPRARLSGEILEYKRNARVREGRYYTMNLANDYGDRAWFESVQNYLYRWVFEHYDGKEDTWTPRHQSKD